jgi:BirA family biotin operon repressor/biotin-[acetyl-CoA-carboxylase] ligase
MHGDVIWADWQSAGRGAYGNSWHTPPGAALLWSVLWQLPPTLAARLEPFDLTRAAAYGLVSALQDAYPGLDLSIKWPNDILIESNKLAGILIETLWSGGQLERSIVGIGLNLYECPALTGTPIARHPTCLADHISLPNDESTRLALLHSLLDGIGWGFNALTSGSAHRLRTLYDNKLYRLGQLTRFRCAPDDAVREAVVSGTKPAGELMLQFPEGSQAFFEQKTLQWLE